MLAYLEEENMDLIDIMEKGIPSLLERANAIKR